MKIYGTIENKNVEIRYTHEPIKFELSISNWNYPYFFKLDTDKFNLEFESFTDADYRLTLWNKNFCTIIDNSKQALETILKIEYNKNYSIKINDLSTDIEEQDYLHNCIYGVLLDKDYGMSSEWLNKAHEDIRNGLNYNGILRGFFGESDNLDSIDYFLNEIQWILFGNAVDDEDVDLYKIAEYTIDEYFHYDEKHHNYIVI